MKKLLLMIFSSLVLFASEGAFAIVEGVRPISMQAVEKLLDDKSVYIYDVNERDVRLQYGYLPGARFINQRGWQDLLPKDKTTRMIFYCLNRMCYASSDAAKQAMALGYERVEVMLDGIESWILSGRPVEKGGVRPLLKSFELASFTNGGNLADFKDRTHENLRFGNLPACRDCHKDGAGKGIGELANDKDSVNANCADCHKDEKLAFAGSVHDAAVNPREKSPSCNDCHKIHTASFSAVEYKKAAEANCAECHKKAAEHGRASFHGKALALSKGAESQKMASCFDCHGAHDVHKSSEGGHLFGDARVKTCAKCHPNANAKFAEYNPHADHHDSEKEPLLYYAFIFMSGLVIAVFAAFGLHTLLWSAKLIYMRLRYKEAFLAQKHAMHEDKRKIKRFSTLHKIQHFFCALSFLGLSLSGLPQKFAEASWAQSMIDLLGGVKSATFIHHLSAAVMIAVFLSHIAEIIYRAYRNRAGAYVDGRFSWAQFGRKLFGPDSLMPRAQDIRDVCAHFKWFVGRGERPKFDRFTYWEKFDYLAVFWGMFIIGFSGLALWYPTTFGAILGGKLLNLAALVHSDEALLAMGFIFAVHFFNTHFRADRFPMDMVIFSGELSEKELEIDRPAWYERLKESGKLEQLRNENSSFERYYAAARTIGFVMLGSGLVFLLLMIIAVLEGAL